MGKIINISKLMIFLGSLLIIIEISLKFIDPSNNLFNRFCNLPFLLPPTRMMGILLLLFGINIISVARTINKD